MGGMWVDSATPSSDSIAATSAAQASPVTPSSPCSRSQPSRTASGASMQVIQLTSVPPPTPVPASIVIEPSQVVVRPWSR